MTVFLCDNNKQLEIKIMKTIPFVKYNILRINLTKDVKSDKRPVHGKNTKHW